MKKTSRTPRRSDVPGTIYLLHFEPRYKHAGHYLGWTGGPVGERIEAHLEGRGNPLVRAAVAAGCAVTLVRTWAGTRALERRIKDGHAVVQACPRCCKAKPIPYGQEVA